MDTSLMTALTLDDIYISVHLLKVKLKQCSLQIRRLSRYIQETNMTVKLPSDTKLFHLYILFMILYT